jgi:hypothetical protein
MIDPRTFIAEYVDPAISLWQSSQQTKHLAIHAITQLDVLAEIVLLWTRQGQTPTRQAPSAFRETLANREPVLAVIRDAHDSHKHGILLRQSATNASKGQRPETVTKVGMFLDHDFLDSPGTPYQALVFILDDGTEKPIFDLLLEARQAWDRELARLGL